MSDGASVTADIRDAKRELEATMRALLAVPTAVLEVAHEARDRLEDLTPADTGATGQLWYVRPTGKDGVEINHPFNEVGATHPDTGDLMNDGNYNHLEGLEYGTKPHTIAAKNGGYLRWESNGGVVFARSVKHPGTRPHAMVRAVAEEVPEMLRRRVDDLLQRRR